MELKHVPVDANLCVVIFLDSLQDFPALSQSDEVSILMRERSSVSLM